MAAKGFQRVFAKFQESISPGTCPRVTMAIPDRESWCGKILPDMVLAQEETVDRTASAYIDNIYINKDVVPATHVREHLAQFGLECKDPERLKEGAQVLGLTVAIEQGDLRWKRGKVVPGILGVVMRRTVFSMCERLVEYLSQYGWLRVVCRILNRRASLVTKGWEDETKDAFSQRMVSEIEDSVEQDDPARGDWCVDDQELNVWIDARSLTIGVALERHETVLEDTCWLRPENDTQHINLVELDTVLKGVNFILQWKSKVLHVKTDSVCVYHRVSVTLTGSARVRTKTASEMLIRRRLNTLNRRWISADGGCDVGIIDPEYSRSKNECSNDGSMRWGWATEPGHWLVLIFVVVSH